MAPAGAAFAADESTVPHYATLNDAWWNVTAMIGQGESWGACARQLEDALAVAGDAPQAQPCRALLESIRLTMSHTTGDAVAAGSNAFVDRAFLGDTTPIDDLIAALPESRVPFTYVLKPLQVYGGQERLVWASYADVRSTGPDAAAGALFRRGREAVPALIAALTDQRATRCVAADPQRAGEPLVYRVGDVALGLIEAITCCRFHLSPSAYNPRTKATPLVSQWPADKRHEQYELIDTWWNATRRLTPPNAALLRIKDVPKDEQLEMLDALIVTGARAEVVRYLQPLYRAGDALNREYSVRMLRAGSRAPLEFVREYTASGSAPGTDMISLIVDFGGIDDFKLLRDAIRRSGDNNLPIDTTTVISRLNYCNSPLAVPVLVAVLEHEPISLTVAPVKPQTGRIPGNLQRAAERIQQLTGIDFGFDSQAPSADPARGIDDILRWWRREGQAAYDFEQVRPQAPGGIR